MPSPAWRPEDEEHVREGVGPLRRDYEPHSLNVLRGLTRTALLCGVFSYCCFGLAGPAGVGFGLAAWALARHDLRRLRAGLVDPGAGPEIERARHLGLRGALVSGLGSAIWLLLAWSLRP